MTDELLPHGPWSRIFQGTWSGFDVEVLENPERLALIRIKAGEKTVFILDKFFAAEGEITRLAQAFAGFSIVLEKRDLDKKNSFFAISSGPLTAEPDAEPEVIEKALRMIEEQSMRVRELEKTRGVQLTDLKYAEEQASRLFSEPAVLFGLLAGKAVQMPKQAQTRRASLLGLKLDGMRAEEDEWALTRCLVIGEDAEADKAMHVLVENAALAGLTCIVFDERSAFSKMDNPNRAFAYATYPDLQPVGFPLKTITPEEVGVDLNLLSTQAFREILHLPTTSECLCKQAVELLDAALENVRGRAASTADLEEALLAQAEEVKKFHVYRAVRLLKVLAKKHPDMLKGRAPTDALKPRFIAGLGSVIRIDTQDLTKNVKAAFILSVLKTLKTTYESQAGLKAVIFLPDAENLAPLTPKTKTQEETIQALLECSSTGLGFCIAVQHEIDASQIVTDRATARLEFVGLQEIAVKTEKQRPYRMRLRPPLSAE